MNSCPKKGIMKEEEEWNIATAPRTYVTTICLCHMTISSLMAYSGGQERAQSCCRCRQPEIDGWPYYMNMCCRNLSLSFCIVPLGVVPRGFYLSGTIRNCVNCTVIETLISVRYNMMLDEKVLHVHHRRTGRHLQYTNSFGFSPRFREWKELPKPSFEAYNIFKVFAVTFIL